MEKIDIRTFNIDEHAEEIFVEMFHNAWESVETGYINDDGISSINNGGRKVMIDIIDGFDMYYEYVK